jgi:hypothetical protein
VLYLLVIALDTSLLRPAPVVQRSHKAGDIPVLKKQSHASAVLPSILIGYEPRSIPIDGLGRLRSTENSTAPYRELNPGRRGNASLPNELYCSSGSRERIKVK